MAEQFKTVLEQLDTQIKKNKAQRAQNIKRIKTTFKDLQKGNPNKYESALDRAYKNLAYFRDNNFNRVVAGMDDQPIIQEHQKKIQAIEREIKKMDVIIEQGCGNLVRRSTKSGISSQGEISVGEIQRSKVEE